MNVALYARVSTHKCRCKAKTDKTVECKCKVQDPELQLRELREYCKVRDWQVVGEYTDRGVSGAKESRPELNRLLEDARAKKFDGIAVWKLDRFGRSLSHLIHVLEELRKLDVTFVSTRDAIDLSTATGTLMFHLLGAFAQFERALTQERVIAGLENARAKGKRLGRPEKTNNVDIRRLLANGHNQAQVAGLLGISDTTVSRRLREQAITL
jgi:DNA invertase Pin-like site-specific DNA recombinase